MRVDEQEADEGVARGTSGPWLAKSLSIFACAVVPTAGMEVDQDYLGRSAPAVRPRGRTERKPTAAQKSAEGIVDRAVGETRSPRSNAERRSQRTGRPGTADEGPNGRSCE
jgi:hypothetical protein